MDKWKKSGQIPAFGDWERANEMPITQYFESARQAGLIRFSNSSGECEQYVHGDLYSANFNKPSSPPRKGRGLKKGGEEAQVKEQKRQQQRKVCDDVVFEPQRKHHRQHQLNYYMSYDDNNDSTDASAITPTRTRFNVRNPKPVDEDLYKIPPHLLRHSKRKKVPGFFSCLASACAS